MQAILFGIMGLVLMLGLAKADKVNEKIIPFWEQISLSGNRAIEWLKVDGENGQFIPTCLNIKTLLKGDVKYFFKHFDFEHTMQHMKDLSLESEIMLLQCTNFDRWVLVVQKSAQKSLIKVLGIEWANEKCQNYMLMKMEIQKLWRFNLSSRLMFVLPKPKKANIISMFWLKIQIEDLIKNESKQ